MAEKVTGTEPIVYDTYTASDLERGRNMTDVYRKYSEHSTSRGKEPISADTFAEIMRSGRGGRLYKTFSENGYSGTEKEFNDYMLNDDAKDKYNYFKPKEKAEPVSKDSTGKGTGGADITKFITGEYEQTDEFKQKKAELEKKYAELQGKYIAEFKQTPEFKSIIEAYNASPKTASDEKKSYDDMNAAFTAMYKSRMDEDSKAIRDEYAKQYESDIEKFVEGNSAYKRIMEYDKSVKIEDEKNNIKGEIKAMSSELNGMMGKDLDRRALGVITRINEGTNEVLDAPKDGGFFKGMLDSLTNIDNYLMGLGGLNDAMYIKDLLKKVDNDEKLTPWEDKVLESLSIKYKADTLRAGDVSGWYQAGKNVGDTLPFVATFILTSGLGGLAEKAGQKTTDAVVRGLNKYMERSVRKKLASKYGSTKVADEAVDAVMKMYKAGKIRNIYSALAKGAGLLTEGAIRQLPIAAVQTALSPTAWSNLINETQIGDVTGKNEKGEWEIDESRLKSAGESVLGQLIEFQTENAGVTMSQAASGLVNMAIAGSRTKASKILAGVVSTLMAGNAKLSKVGVNGLPAEMLEEHLGEIERYALGLSSKEDFDKFFSVESQMQMAASFVPQMLVGGVMNLASATDTKRNEVIIRGALRKAGASNEQIDSFIDVAKNGSMQELADEWNTLNARVKMDKDTKAVVAGSAMQIDAKTLVARAVREIPYKSVEQYANENFEQMSEEERMTKEVVNETRRGIELLDNKGKIYHASIDVNGEKRDDVNIFGDFEYDEKTGKVKGYGYVFYSTSEDPQSRHAISKTAVTINSVENTEDVISTAVESAVRAFDNKMEFNRTFKEGETVTIVDPETGDVRLDPATGEPYTTQILNINNEKGEVTYLVEGAEGNAVTIPVTNALSMFGKIEEVKDEDVEQTEETPAEEQPAETEETPAVETETEAEQQEESDSKKTERVTQEYTREEFAETDYYKTKNIPIGTVIDTRNGSYTIMGVEDGKISAIKTKGHSVGKSFKWSEDKLFNILDKAQKVSVTVNVTTQDKAVNQEQEVTPQETQQAQESEPQTQEPAKEEQEQQAKPSEQEIFMASLPRMKNGEVDRKNITSEQALQLSVYENGYDKTEKMLGMAVKGLEREISKEEKKLEGMYDLVDIDAQQKKIYMLNEKMSLYKGFIADRIKQREQEAKEPVVEEQQTPTEEAPAEEGAKSEEVSTEQTEEPVAEQSEEVIDKAPIVEEKENTPVEHKEDVADNETTEQVNPGEGVGQETTALAEEVDNASETDNAVTEAAKDFIHDALKDLGIDESEVVIITDEKGLPESAKKMSEKEKAGIKGWYNKETNTVCLYSPNLLSEEDVKKTVMHEVVAHKGLRSLLGDEEYRNFCLRVYDGMGVKLRKKYFNYIASTKGAENVMDADIANEYIANIAENDISQTMLGKIKKAINDIFRKLGFDIKMDDNDIADMLSKSYGNIKVKNEKKKESVEIDTSGKNQYIKKSHLKAVEAFKRDLEEFRQETASGDDEPAQLYENINTSFTLSDIKVEDGVLSYSYDGRYENDMVVSEEVGEDGSIEYYEDEYELMDTIKFWRQCLRRAKKYWSSNPEDLDAMAEGEKEDVGDTVDDDIDYRIETPDEYREDFDAYSEEVVTTNDKFDLNKYIGSIYEFKRDNIKRSRRFFEYFNELIFDRIDDGHYLYLMMEQMRSEGIEIPLEVDLYKNWGINKTQETATMKELGEIIDERLPKAIAKIVNQAGVADLFSVTTDPMAKDLNFSRDYFILTLYARIKDFLEVDKINNEAGKEIYKNRGIKPLIQKLVEWNSDWDSFINGEEDAEDLSDEMYEILEGFVEDYERIVKESCGEDAIDELWSSIKEITDFYQDISLKSGMITKEYYDIMNKRQFYVPERGMFETVRVDKDMYSKQSGGTGKSKIDEQAPESHGERQNLSDDPFAMLLDIAINTVHNAYVNKYKVNVLLPFLEEFGESAYVKSAMELVWSKNDVEKEGLTLDDISKYGYKECEKEVNAMIKYDESPMLKGLENNEKDMHFMIIRDGKNNSVFVVRATNPQFADVINGHSQNSSADMEKFIRNITRWIAMQCTTRSITFGMKNFIRDASSGLVYGYADYGAKFAGRFLVNLAKNIRIVPTMLLTDKMSGDTKVKRELNDALKHGIAVGFHTWKTEDDIRADIKSSVMQYVDGINSDKVKKWAKAPFNESNPWFKFATNIVALGEIMVRYASYKSAIDLGMSKDEAAHVALENTVNLSQHGYKQTSIGSYYIFTNAVLKAVLKMSKTIYKHPGKMALMAAASFVISLICNAGAGDDDDMYSEYERMSNYTLFGITIPVARELPMIVHKAGYYTTLWMNGKCTASDVAAGIVSAVFDELTPSYFNIPKAIRDNNFMILMPDIFKPIAELYANKDFSGFKIYNENKKDYIPAYEQGVSPSAIAKWISRALFFATGGDEASSQDEKMKNKAAIDLDVDKIDYVINQYLPSYRLFNDLINVADKVLRSEKLSTDDVKSILFVMSDLSNKRRKDRRFNDSYYNLKDMVSNYKGMVEYNKGKIVNKYTGKANEDAYNAFVKGLGEGVVNMKIAEKFLATYDRSQKRIKELEAMNELKRQELKDMRLSGASDEEIKAKESEVLLMDDTISKYEEKLEPIRRMISGIYLEWYRYNNGITRGKSGE